MFQYILLNLKHICSFSFFYCVDDKVYLSRYSQWIHVIVLMGKVKGRGKKKRKKKCPRSNSKSRPLQFGLKTWPVGNVTVKLIGQWSVLQWAQNLWNGVIFWQDVNFWASKSSVIKSWNEGLKCQHKHQRSRVWPPGRAIPSIRPELDFLGQGACWLLWCQRQKQPKLRLKIKQAYGSTSCGKKRDVLSNSSPGGQRGCFFLYR